jgi:hypothetical protein
MGEGCHPLQCVVCKLQFQSPQDNKKQSTNVEHCFAFLPIFKDIYTDLKMKWLLLI